MAVTYLRLFPAVNQFELRNGQLNTAGRLKVFFEGTDDLADLYDENGTQLQQPVVLDDNGRARGLFVDSKKVYRLEVYDCYGQLLYTVRKMVPSGGGTGSALGKVYEVVSNDGSILVDKFDEGGTTTFDLSLGIDANELKPSCLRASAAPVTTDGQFVFEQLSREGTLLSVDQSGKVRMEPAWYHFTAIVELSYDGTPVNEAHQVTLWTTLSNSVIDLDTSYAHRESIELSGDIHVVGNNTEFPLGVSGLDTGITASLMSFDIHAVTGHEGNNEYHAGEGITIVNATKTISADFESVQGKLVAGENISITGNVISAGNFSQEQADWTEDDTESPAFIKNKPDLDVYATQAQLTYGLAGKQNAIPDLAQIRAGAAAGASAVQPADLANVATTGSYNDLNSRPNLTVYATTEAMNTALETKQDVISDLATIRSGAAAGTTAVQPADLTAGLATKQDVLTPGDNITISNNVISATDQRQADWEQSDSSAVDYIRNKPDLSTYATDAELTAGLATKQDTINDLSSIRSGAAAGSTAIQPADLAAVATTGDYDDLSNRPAIPTKTSDLTNDSGFITDADAPVKDVQVEGVSVVNAQGIAEISIPATGVLDVEVDGTSVVNAQGVAEIDLSGYATTQALTSGLAGKQDTISDLATIRSGAAAGASAVQPGDLATVATTGDYSDLLNKPTLATVATSGSYNDLSDKPTIPAQVQEVFIVTYGTTTLSEITTAYNAGQAVFLKYNNSLVPLFMCATGITHPYANFIGGSTGASAGSYQQTIWPIYQVNDSNVWSTSWAQALPYTNTAGKVLTSLSNGGVSFEDPAPAVIVDQTYNASSTNAQSGVAIAGALATKQDTISDLAAIRSGAAEGATAVQPGDLATVATTGSYDDLSDKPTIPAAQVNSDWNSNSGVSQILNKPTLSTVATTGDYDDLSNKPSIPAAQVNSDWNASSGVSEILNKPDLSVYATTQALNTGLAGKQDTISDLATIRSGAAAGASAVQPGDLATVATTGDYSDLLNKPTILPYKPVVAGKGVRIVDDTANNRIVVEADETVLYDCSDNYVYGTNSVTLSESYRNFEVIKILNSKGNVQFYYPANNQGVALFTLTNMSNGFLWLIPWTFTSNTVYSGATGKIWTVGTTTVVDVPSNAPSNRWIQPIKIIGVHRIAST